MPDKLSRLDRSSADNVNERDQNHAASCAYACKASQLVNKDLCAVRKEYLFSLPSSMLEGLTALLRNKRDIPLALAFINMLLLAVPAAALLHVFRVQSHVVGLAYMLGNYALFLQASPRV